MSRPIEVFIAGAVRTPIGKFGRSFAGLTARELRLPKAIPPLACAVSIVDAGWCETSEIAEGEKAGMRVEPERPEELAASIERFVNRDRGCLNRNPGRTSAEEPVVGTTGG